MTNSTLEKVEKYGTYIAFFSIKYMRRLEKTIISVTRWG